MEKTTHAPPGRTTHPPGSNHARPPKQPCTPPRSNHACTPPSNHACPPGATMHAPPREQPHMPPLYNHARPPLQPRTPPLLQPCMPPPATMHAPPVNRMTNRCKNITLPQTSFAGGNEYLVYAYIEMVVQQRIQRPGRGLINMKSMRQPLAAISSVTYSYRARGHGPLGPLDPLL